MIKAEPLAVRIVAALVRRGEHLATAESLTGGLIGAAVTAVAGASRAYLGGVVAYDTGVKARLAGVPQGVLDSDGPVATETALAMARGVRALTGADWGIAATGVAGPDPQDGHQPGEVWLAVAGPDEQEAAQRHQFAGDRAAVRAASVTAALGLLAGALGE